ncbi:MAG: hypothetical protein GX629_12850 [Phycisphaerae bacterium]|jgi:hypothetical protein|nr:hypothetical protein [Phycisphaerae bacterium]
MSPRFWISIIVMFAVIIVGCKKEEEAPPAPLAPVEQTPPGVSEQQPSKPQMRVIREPLPQLVRADSQDDPRYSSLFPASDKVDGWIKTYAVRGGDRSLIGDYLPKLEPIFSPYSVDSIATVQYQRIFDGAVETVKIVLIRADSREDAYGMMSVSCPGVDILLTGEVRRQVQPNQICAVKGNYFGIFAGSTDGGDSSHMIEGLNRLVGKVMFEIPERANIPMVVQVFQAEQLPPATTFFLRDISSLEGPAGRNVIDLIEMTDVERVNSLLQLGQRVDFGVAVYENDQWLGPNVVWLAKYPTHEKAMEVYNQYREAVRKAPKEDRFFRNTFFKSPRGRYFLGVWTMETESMARLTNKIEQYLPDVR